MANGRRQRTTNPGHNGPTAGASPLEAKCIEILSHSPYETRSIGAILGVHASPGDIFLLVGSLGAGKTCLAQGILRGLGSDEYARSPTFVLMSQYEGRLPMYHVDLYRVDSVEEVFDLGLDEYLFGDGVCVVEWAEKAPDFFPEQSLMVRLAHVDETTRRLNVIGTGKRFDSILEAAEIEAARH